MVNAGLFVILITVGSMQLGILAEANIRSGIYFFGAAIFLSIVVSFLIGNLLPESTEKIQMVSARIKKNWTTLIFTFVGLITFVLGVSLPIITLEKWAFWESGYSLLIGSLDFIANGYRVLGYALLIFVILLPLLQFVSIFFLYLFIFFKWKERKILKVFLFFDDWSMIDVFGLSLLVFLFKVSGDMEITLHSGFWFLVVTTFISLYISIRMAISAITRKES